MTAALVLVVLMQTAPSAQELYQRGRREYELGDNLAAARADLTRAVQLDPQNANAILYLALVLDHDTTYELSGPAFREAERLAPGNPEVWRYHGEALVNAGDVVGARARYLMAIALDPGYGDAWYMLGRLYRKEGNLDAAIGAFERDARITPKGSAHHELGEIFLTRGDLTRAAHEFELDLGVDATCYESRVNLAGLLLERGDVAGARKQYEESLTYHPADGRALAALGHSYLLLGEDELALGTLRQAADLSPGDPRVAGDLEATRWRLRLRWGWPFAAVPLALLLLLVVVHLRMRRRVRRGAIQQ